MKNIIEYYYNLHPKEIIKKDNKYIFQYNNDNYVLEKYNRPIEDIKPLYELNKKMIEKGILVHEIILNKNNEELTYIKDEYYVLMVVVMNLDIKMGLNDILYITNNTIGIDSNKLLLRSNWVELWETKNDYIEDQISEVGKKYPNLSKYINYYIGLAENAILYVKNAYQVKEDEFLSVSHRRVYDNIYDLYNPLELIYDHRVRDVAEYIKLEFFKDNDAFNIIKTYLNNNYLTYKELLLLYGRLLYPSYFFDLYDDIVNLNLDEEKIEKYILKADDYEIFLKQVYEYMITRYRIYIPEIEWIIKKRI